MTLIEVIAAVSLAVAVVSLSARLLEQIGDAGDRIDGEQDTLARDSNGERFMRELLANVESSTDSTRQFRGEARSLECRTWCSGSRGYAFRCDLLLTIDSLPDSSVVRAQTGATTFILRRQPGAARFQYIDGAPTDSGWRSRWQTSATLPLALALVGSADTSIFAIGPSRE